MQRVQRPWGLPLASDGLLISTVEAGRPAEQAGVQPNDVQLGLAGTPPVAATDANRRVRAMPTGMRVTLRLLRDGSRIEVPVVLGTRPPR